MSDSLPFLCCDSTIPYSHLLHAARMFIVGVRNGVCIDHMDKKEFLSLASKASQADVLLAAGTGLYLLRSWCTTQAWLPSSQPMGADRILENWSLASRTPPPSRRSRKCHHGVFKLPESQLLVASDNCAF